MNNEQKLDRILHLLQEVTADMHYLTGWLAGRLDKPAKRPPNSPTRPTRATAPAEPPTAPTPLPDALTRPVNLPPTTKRLGIGPLVLIIAAITALTGCSTRGTILDYPPPPVGRPAPAPAAADAYPLQIGHTTVHVDKRGPVASGQSGKGSTYLWWPDLTAGQILATVAVTVVNTTATAVPLTDTTIELRHGPNLTPAQDVAGNGGYVPPTQVAGNGQAVLKGSFVLPAADVIGAVVYAPFPQYDGGDPSAPRQQARIAKTSAR